MSNQPRQEHDDTGGVDANQREARPATPPNAADSRHAQSDIGCRVVEFEISGTARQLIELLRPFNERKEKIHLSLMDAEKLTQCDFLADCEGDRDGLCCVGSVDLSALSGVEEVPFNFLRGFTGLESVDLTPLSNVTEIGEHFLDAAGVTQLDLSSLQNVRIVGEGFLNSVKSLKTIDLSPLSKVTRIPDWMLGGCKNLTSVNLQGLSQVQKIGDSFCYCTSLRRLDLNDMKSVIEIGNSFCWECLHLESIDVSGFGNVRRIGINFLSRCPRLKHLDLSPMQNLEEVGTDFLYQLWYSEDEIDGALRVNSSLGSINLSDLRKLKKIGRTFLCGCCNLTHVDLSAMQNLEEVNGHFLAWCTSLKSVNMKGLNKLSAVGRWFLWDASSLEHLDLSGCVSLTHIGFLFCGGCSSLQFVNFSSVEKVSKIEKPVTFFEDCLKLSTVIGLPDCIRDKLPKDHPVRRHGQRYWRMFALLIREKSRGHAYDAFQIWNVMWFVAEFL